MLTVIFGIFPVIKEVGVIVFCRNSSGKRGRDKQGLENCLDFLNRVKILLEKLRMYLLKNGVRL